MRRWWLAIALVLSLGINVGILATLLVTRLGRPPVAAGPSPIDVAVGHRTPPYIARMANELELEGERRQSFVAIQERFFRAMIEGRTRVAQSQRRLRRELLARRPDRERIDRALGELGAAQMALDRAFADNLLDSRELLDPSQERRFLHFLGRLRQLRGDGDRRRTPRAPDRRPSGDPE